MNRKKISLLLVILFMLMLHCVMLFATSIKHPIKTFSFRAVPDDYSDSAVDLTVEGKIKDIEPKPNSVLSQTEEQYFTVTLEVFKVLQGEWPDKDIKFLLFSSLINKITIGEVAKIRLMRLEYIDYQECNTCYHPSVIDMPY